MDNYELTKEELKLVEYVLSQITDKDLENNFCLSMRDIVIFKEIQDKLWKKNNF